jgi:hypothetical protein
MVLANEVKDEVCSNCSTYGENLEERDQMEEKSKLYTRIVNFVHGA